MCTSLSLVIKIKLWQMYARTPPEGSFNDTYLAPTVDAVVFAARNQLTYGVPHPFEVEQMIEEHRGGAWMCEDVSIALCLSSAREAPVPLCGAGVVVL